LLPKIVAFRDWLMAEADADARKLQIMGVSHDSQRDEHQALVA
jgi:hypothetical protein